MTKQLQADMYDKNGNNEIVTKLATSVLSRVTIATASYHVL